jgi:hypothetical protein
MSLRVLNYYSHEIQSDDFRIDVDGPVTRLHNAAPPQWPRIVAAAVCFVAFAVNAGLCVDLSERLPLAKLPRPMVVAFLGQIAWQNCFWFAAGVWQLFWQHKCVRVPRVLEASPSGLIDWRPGLWHCRARFTPRDRIKRVVMRQDHSVFPGLSDRLSLVVYLKKGRLPHVSELATHDVELARRARAALAAAMGLP